jgi:hypothetical protein
MLLPQATAAGDIRIEVAWTANGVSQNETFDLQAHDWLPGKRHYYNITASLTGTCTMTYEANDGKNNKLIHGRTVGASYSLPDEDTFTRSGYLLEGWNTKADGSGTAYRPGESFLCTGDATLYAQWLPGINLTNGDYASGMVSYNNKVFTITTSGSYIITGTSNVYRIKVASGITAAVLLRNVVIDVSENQACAFDMQGANVILTLQGDNTLKSGGSYAGLHVPVGASIRINGITSQNGRLYAAGGSPKGNSGAGAGIGGNGGQMEYVNAEAGGTVYIDGGSVSTNGGNTTNDIKGGSGAGIGGGGGAYGTVNRGGAGCTIYINGGTVHANSGNSHIGGTGAGIGGGGGGSGREDLGGKGGDDGRGGAGGTIYINGGAVTVNSGFCSIISGSGAGIGGGGGGGYIGKSGGLRNNSGNEAKYVGPGEPRQSDNYIGSKGAAQVSTKVGSGGNRGAAIGQGGSGSFSEDDL